MVAVIGYLAAQQAVLSHVVGNTMADRSKLVQAAGELERLGVRSPCLITGSKPIEVAYLLGCESTYRKPLDATIVPGEAQVAMRTKRVVAVAHAPVPTGSYLTAWDRFPLPGGRRAVYLAPDDE